MKLSELVRPGILTQPVYEPGKPIDDVARELGLDPATIVKLASNENPFGPSPLALEAARLALAQGQLYPDGACVALRGKLAVRHGLAPEQFVCGNGSNEIIELVCHAFLGPGDEAVMGEMVEALVLAVALARRVDERQISRLALRIRRLALALEKARLERERDLLGEADADEAAGRHRIPVADQPHRVGGGDDLAGVGATQRFEE